MCLSTQTDSQNKQTAEMATRDRMLYYDGVRTELLKVKGQRNFLCGLKMCMLVLF